MLPQQCVCNRSADLLLRVPWHRASRQKLSRVIFIFSMLKISITVPYLSFSLFSMRSKQTCIHLALAKVVCRVDWVQVRKRRIFQSVTEQRGPHVCCRIDVSKLEPLVAAPHSPDNRKTAHECSSTKIDRVYIGCAARRAVHAGGAQHIADGCDQHKGVPLEEFLFAGT